MKSFFLYFSVFTLVFWEASTLSAKRLSREAKPEAAAPQGKVSRQACEGETLNISCPYNEVIQIIQANYGRFATLPCNPSFTDWPNTQCVHGQSLEVMIERCDSRQSCSVPATDDVFYDPCPETYKYLEVIYRCQKAAPPPTTPKPIIIPVTEPPNENPPEEESIIPINEPITESAEIVDTQDKQESVTEKATLLSIEEPERAKFCPATLARDVEWPQTELGHWSNQRCPNDGNEPPQFGRWFCGTDAVWIGASPDLTNCVSQWAKNVELSSKHINSEQAALEVARKVKEEVLSNPLYGGDTVTVTNVLETVVLQSNEHLRRRPRAEQKRYSSDLGKVLVNTGSYLIHDRNKEAWWDLNRENRIRSANNILDSVELNANLLAETMRAGEQTETVIGPGQYVVLEVTVVQIQPYVQFPSMSLFDNKIDSVRVPKEALTGNGLKDEASVVFASYKNVGDLLTPNPVRKTVGRKSLMVERKIVSKVITAKVAGSEPVENLKEPVVITMKIEKDENLTNPECVFWDKKLDSYGQWSSEGCKVSSSNDTHVVCSCDHLTNFAVLMDVKGLGFSYVHTVVLSFITYIGCVISIVCLLMSIVAFCIMRGSSSDRVTIHVNLCLCLLIAEIVFVFGIPQTQFPTVCSVIAGLLHYFFLAAFAWMLLEGFQLYALLVEVFETEYSRKKWFYLFGYGIPAVIVGITVGVDRDGYGTPQYCWLRTDNYFVLSFVGPVVVVLAANAILLGMAIVIMCRHNHLSLGYRHCQHRSTIENMGVWLKGATVLVFLLGLTWTFGILYINADTTVMAYLFTVFNSLQGMFIFLFHVVLNDKMRKEYRKWVRRNDWLPKCLRDSTLVDYQPANGIQKVPTNSSSHGTTASSPMPLSDSTSSGGTQSYLSKFLTVNTKGEPRYNSSAQLLLGKYGSYEVSHKYDYAFVHGVSESSEEGTVTTPLSTDVEHRPEFLNFLQIERCHPHRPPPNFPPPRPPIYEELPGILTGSEVLVQNVDGRIVFDLGNGPSKNSADGGGVSSNFVTAAGGKRPISAKSSANSDDSAYSEGSSFRSRNPGPRMTAIRRFAGDRDGIPGGEELGFICRRGLSRSPDSMLNGTTDSCRLPRNVTERATSETSPTLGKLYASNLNGVEEDFSVGATEHHDSSVLSLPDLSYEIPRATAERISPTLLSPLPSPNGSGQYSSAGGHGNNMGQTTMITGLAQNTDCRMGQIKV